MFVCFWNVLLLQLLWIRLNYNVDLNRVFFPLNFLLIWSLLIYSIHGCL
jgi:hypothetical protein